jgi:hypothetical protein
MAPQPSSIKDVVVAVVVVVVLLLRGFLASRHLAGTRGGVALTP